MNFAEILGLVVNLYCIAIAAGYLVKTLLPDQHATGWYLKLRDSTEPVVNLFRKWIPPIAEVDLAVYAISILAVKLLSKIILWLFFS